MASKFITLAWPLLWIQICNPVIYLSSPFEHLMGISHSSWLKFNFWFPSQHPKPILLQVFPIPVSGITFIHSLSQKPKSHFRFFSFSLPLYLVHQQVLLVQPPIWECERNDVENFPWPKMTMRGLSFGRSLKQHVSLSSLVWKCFLKSHELYSLTETPLFKLAECSYSLWAGPSANLAPN